MPETIYCYKTPMEKYTALLISTYLCALFAVWLPGVLQGWLSPLTVLSAESLLVLLIGGALSGLMTVFLARATCYLFVETAHKIISKR